MDLTAEKRFENVNEYKAALKLAKFDATAKLARLKAKEKALGLVKVRVAKLQERMDLVRSEVGFASDEYHMANTSVDQIISDWHDSI